MRLIQKAWSYFQIDVSIHASVKDATLSLSTSYLYLLVSIHASVKDATYAHSVSHQILFVSIHASVKDATFLTPDTPCFLIGFNPRICKRCDFFGYQTLKSFRVSIHASVKDATPYLPFAKFYPPVSIHASVKDATFLVSLSLLRILFQSTHL